MPFKDKLASLFSGRTSKEEGASQDEEKEVFAPEEPSQPAVSHDPSLLELPVDHPLCQLRELWQSSKLHSPLRLSMDETGELPPELLAKEKNRLQSALKTVCASRYKLIRAHARTEKDPKQAEEETLVLDARPYFFLSSDKLYAWALVLPPVGPGAELSREMLQQALTAQGITYGVDEALVNRLSHDRERYFNLYLIARGTPAFDGRNGNIVDNVPRELSRVLEVNEYGMVDYTALNRISNVEQGQEICHLIRPTEGEPGRTVLDQEVPARSGTSVSLPKGRNTEISEDGESLLASIAGHVEFSGRCFQVKPVLDIDGDVDFSTGSLKFVGDINIKGDILSGFSVKAMGNIYVGGVIEAGTTVESGGDLTVVKGILGGGSTVIRCSGCVFAKYIENATISAKENLQTDCVVNSKIYCDGEVVVRSGRGSILGGRIWAAKKVSASAIGARSEVRTHVSLGGQPCASLERKLVRQELNALRRELKRLDEQPDNPARSSLMGKVRMKKSVVENRLNQLEEDLASKKAGEKDKDSGRMECDIAYAGTEIRFGDRSLRLRHESRPCAAKLLYGEIVLM